MIPNADIDLDQSFEFKEMTGKTYHLDLNTKSINGYVDDLEAVKQTALLILNVERYEYDIYSWDYGFELNDLYGRRFNYVWSELKRRIKEALMEDDRIMDVKDFSYEKEVSKLMIKFSIVTELGTIDMEKEVLA